MSNSRGRPVVPNMANLDEVAAYLEGLCPSKLPLELRLRIVAEVATFDLASARAICTVNRHLARIVPRLPNSGLHQVLRLTGGLQGLLRVDEDLRSGRINHNSVRAIFLVNWTMQHHTPDELSALAKRLKGGAQIPRGSTATDVAYPALRSIADQCKHVKIMHVWEPVRGMLEMERESTILVPYPFGPMTGLTELSGLADSVPQTPSRPRFNSLDYIGLKKIHFTHPRLNDHLVIFLATNDGWTALRLTRPIATAQDIDRFLGDLVPWHPFQGESRSRAIYVELGYEIPAVDLETHLLHWRHDSRAMESNTSIYFLHHSLGNTADDPGESGWSQQYALKQCVRSVRGQPSWWRRSDRDVKPVASHEAGAA